MKLILIALLLSVFLVVGSYANKHEKSAIESGLAGQEEMGVDTVMDFGRVKRGAHDKHKRSPNGKHSGLRIKRKMITIPGRK